MNAFLPTTGFCPITQRDPAACVYIGFRRACAKFREQLYQKTGVRLDQPCRPVPPPVEPRISVATIPPTPPIKETVMPTNASKTGKCHACGKTKSLINHLGKRVCSACMPVRIAAKNNPQVVIAALREFGGLRDTGKKDESLREINDLKEEIAKLSAENAAMREKISSMPDPASNLVGEICKHILVDGRGVTIDIHPLYLPVIPV